MYQTILYQYSTKTEINNQYKTVFSKLKYTGSLFIFFENKYDKNGNIEESLFDLIDVFLKLNFKFINTIIYPVRTASGSILKRNVSYVLWFVRDNKSMFFNKDAIREKHIWKDVEWGKREENYNPKGKDPGNVWIPTIDNGRGTITKHILMTIEDVINRCITATYKKNEKIFLKIPNIVKSKILHKESIVFDVSVCEAKILNNKNAFLAQVKLKQINRSVGCNGDIYFSSSEEMSQLENNSIDLMVTSPPYWDLKNYFKKGQIGQENYLEYLNRINEVWNETFRVLKNNSSMLININIRMKDGELIPIPDDIIVQCRKLGFNLKDIVIWHKSSGIPTHKNNIVDRYEFVLWFTKGDDIKVNSIAIDDYKNNDINQGLIWNINRKAGSVGKNYIHPAIYPNKLIDRIIQLCSDYGDTILDPFLGSGTTMISALNNNRSCVGYEFNEGFLDLIKHRADKEVVLNKSNIKFHIANPSRKIDLETVFRNAVWNNLTT